MVTNFILLSFYSFVGGWISLYLVETITDHLNQLTEQGYSSLFEQFVANPAYAIGAQFIFMLITIYIVARVVQKGIEKASKFMMQRIFLFQILYCQLMQY